MPPPCPYPTIPSPCLYPVPYTQYTTPNTQYPYPLPYIRFNSVALHSNTFHYIALHDIAIITMTYIAFYIGSEIVLGSFFPVLFFFPWISCSVHVPCSLQDFGGGSGICRIFEFEPSIFHGICNILVLLQHLELDAAISTVFTTCLSSNLSFSMKFATLWCSNCSCNGRLQLVFI